ncbi:hypothetical protein PHYBLDRAFT_171843 [Phycomyces blakesleeanus NRRL 1555(-)]|uniref:Uncharacterized protein n=1 Tax=Phycomyces blakesleeanus (strain ATCC 8743b / DSM 1359 / FGSC 10004 / NBRC 33097 / NRRL 1555) TaxID=763407 RepID=A0A162NHX2_PHYB8|nr:hypothetical protein PHYBLDRAFT_171843 [Phycomyces blakesleeanus NRRL 1555(-)]OAD69824.1 hypothetical protein PHYBLDRAFT_171843 [Phycomyces blakesleeanus NRRL 1555(-)]|eukprot:XP_018287864.1 hypothetical protein PHYBLDRAFT_171843 [Phycomyces blakesleeanus NRRL 1555(-)]
MCLSDCSQNFNHDNINMEEIFCQKQQSNEHTRSHERWISEAKVLETVHLRAPERTVKIGLKTKRYGERKTWRWRASVRESFHHRDIAFLFIVLIYHLNAREAISFLQGICEFWHAYRPKAGNSNLRTCKKKKESTLLCFACSCYDYYATTKDEWSNIISTPCLLMIIHLGLYRIQTLVHWYIAIKIYDDLSLYLIAF